MLLALVIRISYLPLNANPLKTFVCPFVPWLPCAGVWANLYLICSLPIDAVYRVLVWTVVGFVIYFCYGMSHSKLEKAAQEKHRLVEQLDMVPHSMLN